MIKTANKTKSTFRIKPWTPVVVVLLFSLVIGGALAETPPTKSNISAVQPVKYIILMIGDGMGANQAAAADLYTGQTPEFQTWSKHWMSTYEYGGDYDPQQAWTNFNYVKNSPTDSASAATAMYTGVKTVNGRIDVSADGSQRLDSISEDARQAGWSAGAVTSVYISHATPGAWIAHNSNRNDGFAIADEGLWGNPNTTGTPATDPAYGGGFGPTMPPVDVLIGAGHPSFGGGTFVDMAQRDKLANESGTPGAFTFVERQAGHPDGGTRLLNAASDPAVTRLAGLFGGSGGNLEYRMANGSGYNPENPTLPEETSAALQVLSRNPHGFILMVEGGAIDWAATGGNMDQMLGEVIDFNNAVQTVIDWVDSPSTDATWSNTLVIVTADHETGYLTAAPGVYPNQSLGEVSQRTLGLEKTVSGSGLRASWEDTNNNNAIDPGETVYWAWNVGAHSNSLVPIYAKGPGTELLDSYTVGDDPVRGAYMDNTSIHTLLETELQAAISPTPTFTPGPSPTSTSEPSLTSTPTNGPTPTSTPIGFPTSTPSVTPSDFIYLPLTEK